MIGEVPGIVVAIVIGVVIVALAVGLAGRTKTSGQNALTNFDNAAQDAFK